MDWLKGFSDNTRVWVYQSPRVFTQDEVRWIGQAAKAFLASWNAHGKPVKATFQLLFDRVLVIAADQDFTVNSGCSIDSSISFIRSIEQHTGVDLMDCMLVLYEKDGEVHSLRLQELPEYYKSGKIEQQTRIFNPLVNSKTAFVNEWQVELRDSWHSRFL